MPSRRRLLTTALLACVLLLTACAVNKSGTAGEAETGAQFAAQAEKACTDAGLTLLGGPAPYTAAQYTAIQTQLLELRRTLDALIPPESLQQHVSDLLNEYSAVADAAGAAAQGLGAGQPPEAVQATYAAAVAAPLAAIGATAQAIGAPACGQLSVSGQ